ncbi:DUF1206 domain-containing protein [Streptomyces sp. AcE210]|uniref:DUF1206 domain-containing protein n=1 Tax=Streptomyces sp. AcE210 TaxID=2292703 RepID=UPI000E3097F1|nr:DUF1206 domain-containing protein [Streptomyces sp. AcE210]RFC75209.1 DUF1206 domain-containing protein [Streptomyces sp. AcE210]
MTPGSATARGRGQARRAANSTAVATGARAGFVARGIIYVLIGVLSLQISFSGGGGKQADRGGAIAEIAGKPFGAALLWLLGTALAGMALWRLSGAAFGQAGPDGKKASKRAMAAGRCVFYGFVSYSVLSYAAGDKSSGSGSSDQNSRDITSKALDWPAGQWIVAGAGAAVAAAGAWIAVRALRRKFQKHLKMSGMSPKTRQTVTAIGVFGGTSRGVVFAVAGGFALAAAVQHKPGKAKGMDDTLRSFADTPVGPWLLVLIAVGLVAFGVFSWASARWRKL